MDKFFHIGIFWFAACALFGSAPALAQDAAVAKSTQTLNAAAPVQAVEQFYRAENLIDPFIPAGAGGETSSRVTAQSSAKAAENMSIHDLVLTGIMEDEGGKQALLNNPATGLNYVLSKGRLWDIKKKQVPGISGVIRGKQVVLMTADEDIQPLNLHEKEKK